MIKDIISFCIKDIYLAVDLQTAPIILSASEYTNPNIKSMLPSSIEYEGKEVSILNNSKSVELRINKITESTKILVGELGDKMFGLYVDEVLGIVNVANAGS